MATLSSIDTTALDSDLLNLTRLLTRLQETLLEADAAAEVRLRNSKYERSKLRNNISYAQNLLIQLERDALGLTAQSRRQDAQAELLQKHDLLQQLSEKLQEWDEIADEEEYSSEGEDVLGEDTPSDSVEAEHPSPNPLTPTDPSPTSPNMPIIEPEPKPQTSTMSDRDKLFSSSLRARHGHLQGLSNLTDTGTTTGAQPSTSITESLLTDNRTEQEALTTSLLSIAQQLRESTQTFSSSLESEKDILNRATDGLEKNVTGMEAAQARMGFLRKMTEGQGWWGRMKLYAYIFGLMIVAFSIVAFLPKLRF